MEPDERLRLDYDQTVQLLRTLTDVRFKLLAFVPTIAAAGVGFFGRPRAAAELLAIGLLGLAATLGILIYELRNSQVFDAVRLRAEELERRLGLPSAIGGEGAGGLFGELPGATRRLLGFRVAHRSGLALVYGSAIAGWSYIAAWGALRAIDLGGARPAGVALGAAVGLLVAVQVDQVDRGSRPD